MWVRLRLMVNDSAFLPRGDEIEELLAILVIDFESLCEFIKRARLIATAARLKPLGHQTAQSGVERVLHRTQVRP
jgi:hypothetical protein